MIPTPKGPEDAERSRKEKKPSKFQIRDLKISNDVKGGSQSKAAGSGKPTTTATTSVRW